MTFSNAYCHDDVIKWKHFPSYWPFMGGIQWPRVNSQHKGQWRGALMFSLICAWMNGWGWCPLWRHRNVNENVWMLKKFSLKFVPKGLVSNIAALVKILTRCRPGDKPLSEPMMVSWLMNVCVRSQLLIFSCDVDNIAENEIIHLMILLESIIWKFADYMDWYFIIQVFNSFWYDKDWITTAGTEVGISLYWRLPGWQMSIQTDPYLLHLAWFCQEWVDEISSDIIRMFFQDYLSISNINHHSRLCIFQSKEEHLE